MFFPSFSSSASPPPSSSFSFSLFQALRHLCWQVRTKIQQRARLCCLNKLALKDVIHTWTQETHVCVCVCVLGLRHCSSNTGGVSTCFHLKAEAPTTKAEAEGAVTGRISIYAGLHDLQLLRFKAGRWLESRECCLPRCLTSREKKKVEKRDRKEIKNKLVASLTCLDW